MPGKFKENVTDTVNEPVKVDAEIIEPEYTVLGSMYFFFLINMTLALLYPSAHGYRRVVSMCIEYQQHMNIYQSNLRFAF